MAVKDVVSSREKGGGEKKVLVGLVWKCAAELKLFVTALLLLCSLATVLQFLPPRFSFSPDIRLCLSSSANILTPASPSSISNTTIALSSTTNTTTSSSSTTNSTATALPSTPNTTTTAPSSTTNTTTASSTTTVSKPSDPTGVIKRNFLPTGSAAYNFILMSAYRGGANTFAITGLSSKPLHVYGHPTYQCEYIPTNSTSTSFSVTGTRILPDWGYGRVYTVVVINCTFQHPAVGIPTGGTLLLHATTNGGIDLNHNTTDTITTLTEPPNNLHFTSPPKYDFLYCGSSLYGSLSPQRLREWLSYHIRLFGQKSHFVIHDAGGVHPEVMEVLKPWMELGYVTVQDIKEQERFDGYYHNQFLIVNDCLHRYRFDTKWMFFFDVDEYVYIPGKKESLKSVMDGFSEYSQVTIEQITMSSKICRDDEDKRKINKKWGMEKLVYRDIKRGIRRDRKYAIRPTQVFATGVHMSQNLQGKTNHRTDKKIKYYHYHGTIAERREPCRVMINDTQTSFEGTPYVLDTTMRDVAPFVKRFEHKMIGNRLQSTRQ